MKDFMFCNLILFAIVEFFITANSVMVLYDRGLEWSFSTLKELPNTIDVIKDEISEGFNVGEVLMCILMIPAFLIALILSFRVGGKK